MTAIPMLEGARVLVLEDEYFIASDLVRALDVAGARPIGPAGTIQQATELIEQAPVDAAILDLNLHGEFAFPLIERLKAAGTPCVIVSGYGRESIPETLRDVPNIEKPVNQAKVIASLEVALGRTG